MVRELIPGQKYKYPAVLIFYMWEMRVKGRFDIFCEKYNNKITELNKVY